MNGSRHLTAWDEVITRAGSGADLLLGNGFSIGRHAAFGYERLVDEAGLEPLTAALMSAARSSDFEQAMGFMEAVEDADLRFPDGTPPERSTEIRSKITAAINRVHPDSPMGLGLTELKPRLRYFHQVFTTNYDLLPYWLIQVETPGPPYDFVDLFYRGSGFSPGIATLYPQATQLLYVHGALHLQEVAGGQTVKLTRDSEWTLPQWIDYYLHPPPGEDPALPLIVLESSTEAKLRAITGNAYLFHCHQQLAVPGPIVVYGHALKPADEHIVDAIARRQSVAFVSVFDNDWAAYERLISAGVAAVPFDARTSPLFAEQV